MAAYLAGADRHGTLAGGPNMRSVSKSSSDPRSSWPQVCLPFELDVASLVEGTGRWENMQAVVRSAIKSLLDAQFEHQRQIAAHQKQMNQMQALLISTRRLAADKPSREEGTRAAAQAAENAAGLSELRAEALTIQENAKTEAEDLQARLESKASKDHVRSCLEGKADQVELVEIRGRIGRVCSGAGLGEAKARQAAWDKTVALEKRLGAFESRVKGCEAHAVRADPTAVALRIEKLSSALRDVRKRVDKKADASATERVLAEKVDESALETALKPKADRTDLSVVENSAACLLAVSSERAATATTLTRDLAALTATVKTDAAALTSRANAHDESLAELTAAVVRVRDDCRAYDKGLRGASVRVERVEKALSTVARAAAEAASRASKAAGAARRRSSRREQDRVHNTHVKADAVTLAVEALTKRVDEWNPCCQASAARELVDTTVSASAARSAASTGALSQRLLAFERSTRGEFALVSKRLDAAGLALAKAEATKDETAAVAAEPQQQQHVYQPQEQARDSLDFGDEREERSDKSNCRCGYTRHVGRDPEEFISPPTNRQSDAGDRSSSRGVQGRHSDVVRRQSGACDETSGHGVQGQHRGVVRRAERSPREVDGREGSPPSWSGLATPRRRRRSPGAGRTSRRSSPTSTANGRGERPCRSPRRRRCSCSVSSTSSGGSVVGARGDATPRSACKFRLGRSEGRHPSKKEAAILGQGSVVAGVAACCHDCEAFRQSCSSNGNSNSNSSSEGFSNGSPLSSNSRNGAGRVGTVEEPSSRTGSIGRCVRNATIARRIEELRTEKEAFREAAEQDTRANNRS